MLELQFLSVGKPQRNLVLMSSGWNFATTDHAIGRLYERGEEDPIDAIEAAHDALCGATLPILGRMLQAGGWTIPTHCGAFLASVHVVTEAPPYPDELIVYVVAETWLSRDQMHADQEREAMMMDGREPRYLDGPLAPFPLREPLALSCYLEGLH